MQLYNKYCEGMFLVANRFLRNTQEAEDAMQEAFISAFLKLKQFQGEVSFGAWLKKIVINKCLDKLKARKLEYVALNENVITKVDDEKTESWEVDENTGIKEVTRALENLPEKYKYPLMLFLMEGYDHEEISEILNITQVASRTLIHRGKKKLMEELKIYKNGTRY